MNKQKPNTIRKPFRVLAAFLAIAFIIVSLMLCYAAFIVDDFDNRFLLFLVPSILCLSVFVPAAINGEIPLPIYRIISGDFNYGKDDQNQDLNSKIMLQRIRRLFFGIVWFYVINYGLLIIFGVGFAIKIMLENPNLADNLIDQTVLASLDQINGYITLFAFFAAIVGTKKEWLPFTKKKYKIDKNDPHSDEQNPIVESQQNLTQQLTPKKITAFVFLLSLIVAKTYYWLADFDQNFDVFVYSFILVINLLLIRDIRRKKGFFGQFKIPMWILGPTLVIFFFSIIASFGSIDTTYKIESAEIVGYGIYDIADKGKWTRNTATPQGHHWEYKNIEHLQTTDQVPLRKLLTFGYNIEVHILKPLPAITLDMSVKHPPMQKPDGKIITEISYPRRLQCKNKVCTDSTKFEFTHDYEMLPGTWSIEYSYQGELLTYKEFIVYEEE